MFKINDEIRGMTGYIVLDDQLVCFQNPVSGETEIKKCKIELFGGAIKATPNDDINNVLEFFEPYKLSCDIKGNVDDDVYLIDFNNLWIIAPIEGYTALSDYITMVESNSDYFESVYESQSEGFINSNNSLNCMTGIEFEHFCKKMLEKIGFRAETTKTSGDGGIDLIAYNSQAFISGKYIVQCKRYSGSVGEPVIRDLYGVVMSENANKGILITTGTFTSSAINFANGKPIELIDHDKLIQICNDYELPINESSNTKYVTPIFFDTEILGQLDTAEKKRETYNIILREFMSDPNDKLRNRLIAILGDYIEIPAEKFEYIDSDKLFKNKKMCINLLMELIEPYLSYKGNDVKKNRIKCYFMLIKAPLCLMSLDFKTALKLYYEIMENKEVLNDVDAVSANCNYAAADTFDIKDIAHVIRNICRIYILVGLPEKTKSLKNKYRRLFDSINLYYDEFFKEHPEFVQYDERPFLCCENLDDPLFYTHNYFMGTYWNDISQATWLNLDLEGNCIFSLDDGYNMGIKDNLLYFQDTIYTDTYFYAAELNNIDMQKVRSEIDALF